MNPIMENEKKMPVLFIGHGNPMNAILENSFTQNLSAIGKDIKGTPKAILVISAHWLTRGTYVSTNPTPQTIYDFGGFPEKLYQVVYPSPGSPEYAREVMKLMPEAKADESQGLDHGAWTILKHMFPEADIPVFQLSIDYYKPMQYHFDLAQKLKALRQMGVLIIGSGNIVHNVQLFFSKQDSIPYDWAIQFDEWVKEKINNRDFDSLINYEKFGKTVNLSVPTVDHYVPLLYCLALADENETIVFNYEEIISSMSMRCLRIG